MARQWMIGLVVLIAGSAGIAGYHFLSQPTEESASQAAAPALVNVIAPQLRKVEDRVRAVGNLSAVDAVQLTTEVSGRIVELNLPAGERVAQGALLVRLDDRQARSDVAIARAELADAERQLQRARRLQSNNSISRSEVDALKTTVDVARASLESAITRLDNHRIEAPFAGVLGLNNLSVGTYLSSGSELTTLDATDAMELAFSVPERYLGKIRIGLPVQGVTPAFPDETFTGELTELGTRISELSRTLPVKAVIPNSDARLRPGQFMAVQLVLATREALVIPEQAVILRGDNKYVFLAEDGSASRVTVELGSRMPGYVEVVAGLSGQDRVIITGQDRLSDGDRIEAREDDSAIPPNRFARSQEG
jgi:membrane fusion protein (multidrug efflux system)